MVYSSEELVSCVVLALSSFFYSHLVAPALEVVLGTLPAAGKIPHTHSDDFLQLHSLYI